MIHFCKGVEDMFSENIYVLSNATFLNQGRLLVNKMHKEADGCQKPDNKEDEAPSVHSESAARQKLREGRYDLVDYSYQESVPLVLIRNAQQCWLFQTWVRNYDHICKYN